MPPSRLQDLCQARSIRSEGADSFFPALAEKVRALRDLESSDPLPPVVAAATVKRYLADDRFRIRLHDLVGEVVRKTAQSFKSQNLAEAITEAEFLRRKKTYEAGTEVLRHMIVPFCQWGDGRHEVLAVNILELASDYSTLGGRPYCETWSQFRLYPSLLLLYTGGVAALSIENHGMLAALLTRPRYHDHNGERALLLECHAARVFSGELKKFLPGSSRTAPNDYLFHLLRPLIETSFPQEYRYADLLRPLRIPHGAGLCGS